MLRAIVFCALICASASAQEPVQRFRQLEQRLVQARAVQIDFELRSEGAYPAQFAGELAAELPGRIEMQSEGHFAAEQMTLTLFGAEGHMWGGRDGVESFDEEEDHLWEAMALGMTRMGLLHNHARLSARSTPDHANREIEGWLSTRDHAWSPRLEEVDGASHAIQFALDVSGQHSADIVLWLDEDGLPLHREQTVYFEGGSMTAIESYHVEIRDPQLSCPPCRQKLSSFGHGCSVEHDFSHVYVCCPECAEKMGRNWNGYVGILRDMGEDTERLPRREDGFILHGVEGVATCEGCAAGLCDRPELQPQD